MTKDTDKLIPTSSSTPQAPATIDEVISVCIARQVVDGDLWAQGISTPLVMAGFVLAQKTHAPAVRFASAIGQSICRDAQPLRVGRVEDFWLQGGLIHLGFVTAAADLLPRFRPKEFFRPAQVDPSGNFNNIAIGKDYQRPRMRLPGTGGIPDVTPVYDHTFLYVPRHSRLSFVETLDFISGMGHSPERKRGQGVGYLVSDLGQFDWQDGRMRLTHYHPGVSIDSIQRKTGFDLTIADDVSETPAPTDEEVRLLREVIDPLDVRKLETLGGAKRRELLLAILTAEDSL